MPRYEKINCPFSCGTTFTADDTKYIEEMVLNHIEKNHRGERVTCNSCGYPMPYNLIQVYISNPGDLPVWTCEACAGTVGVQIARRPEAYPAQWRTTIRTLLWVANWIVERITDVADRNRQTSGFIKSDLNNIKKQLDQIQEKTDRIGRHFREETQ